MKPEVHSFFHEQSNTIAHVVAESAGRHAAIIDAALDFDQAAGRTETTFADGIIDFVRERQLQIDWLLETHAHADHLSAAPYLKSKLGGRIGIGQRITEVQKLFKNPDATCDACEGEDQGAPIKGMVIMWGLEQDDDEWEGGKIFDPKKGKTYNCKIWLDGDELKVRGYAGPFFRTQTWHRQS